MIAVVVVIAAAAFAATASRIWLIHLLFIASVQCYGKQKIYTNTFRRAK